MTSLISCKVEGPAVRLSWGPCPVSTLCYSSLFPAPVYRAKHLSRYIILGLPKRPFSYFPLLTAYKRLATAGCSARASETKYALTSKASRTRAHDKFRPATRWAGARSRSSRTRRERYEVRRAVMRKVWTRNMGVLWKTARSCRLTQQNSAGTPSVEPRSDRKSRSLLGIFTRQW